MIHAEVYLGNGMAKPITNIEIKFNSRIRRLAKISIGHRPLLRVGAQSINNHIHSPKLMIATFQVKTP